MRNPLAFAAKRGDLDALRQRVKSQRQEPRFEAWNFRERHEALVAAAQGGSAECVRELLRLTGFSKDNPLGFGGDARLSAGLPLREAAAAGQVACLEAMLAAARPGLADPEGRDSLMLAAANRRPEAVRALLRAGSDPMAQARNGDTALSLAAAAGDAESLALLLPWSDPGARGPRGTTPLMRAAAQRRRECVKLLLPASDPKARSAHGRTALQMAAINADLPSARLLLRADPSAALELDPEGLTLLMRAARANNPALVELLLPASDPDQQAPRSEANALMHAVCARASECVLILAPVTDPAARDRHGLTAFERAQSERKTHERFSARASSGHAGAPRRTSLGPLFGFHENLAQGEGGAESGERGRVLSEEAFSALRVAVLAAEVVSSVGGGPSSGRRAAADSGVAAAGTTGVAPGSAGQAGIGPAESPPGSRAADLKRPRKPGP